MIAERVAVVDAAGERAALDWLELSDAGRVRETWSASSAFMRRTISERAWALEYACVRGELGAVVSRVLDGTRVTRRMIGAPDGEYVVFRFHTVFAAQGREVIEKVTVMRDDDGHWRAAGYYVPAPWAPPRGRRS